MSLAAGVVTVGVIGRGSVAVSATAATGGTAPYSYQWQINWPRAGAAYSNATGTGVTTLSAVIKNLGPVAQYNVRLQVTDSTTPTPNVAYSAVKSVRTLNKRWVPRHGA